MSKKQIWETRPLEFWAKAKELRAGWQKSIESKENVVGQGNTGPYCNWADAFPAITLIEDNPVGSMMAARNEPYARKARLASEIRGWGREICGYQGNCWGGQFLGYIEDGSPWPSRKMVVHMPCQCDQHTKRGQQARDFENMPQWSGDSPIYYGPYNEERDTPMAEHNVYCYLRVLNDIERIFGQKLDDEKYFELLKTDHQVRKYGAEVSRIMMTTVPAPLSSKDLFSVFTIGLQTKIDPKATLDFWKMVRDEVKWRADNQIAAVGNERFRWVEAHPPSWHYMKYYRYMEEYGAVCLGSQYSHTGADYPLEIKQDGSLGPRESTNYPIDTPLKTREDGMRFSLGMDSRLLLSYKMDEYIRPDAIVEFATICKADGALLPVWRHGVGCTLTRKEQGIRLKKAGFSVMHYEGSAPGDRTDLDEKRFFDQLDNWMHSLGFRKFDS